MELFACIKEMETPANHNSTIKSCRTCTPSEHLQELQRRDLREKGRVLQGTKPAWGMNPPGLTRKSNSWELKMISTLSQQTLRLTPDYHQTPSCSAHTESSFSCTAVPVPHVIVTGWVWAPFHTWLTVSAVLQANIALSDTKMQQDWECV